MNEPTSYGLQPPTGETGPAEDEGAPPGQRSASPGSASQAPTAPTAPMTERHRLLGGRYRLVRRLGQGGMGTVWVAHDEVVDREVAVKEPRLPEQLNDEQRASAHQRMRREAHAAARITHPVVVTLHDVVTEDEQPWLVMELVRGESLADVLDSGTLDAREAARIGLEVLGALRAAHEAGVLHRDVKPANVLLGERGRVVLTDFGIAQVEGEQGLTETGSFVGSPEFVAPERALGQRPGPESDLWSLGVLLYVAVEGISPFRRNNTPATLQAVLSAEPPQPARAGGPLGALVTRLLRKEPGARPSPEEIRRELEAVVAPPPPPPPLAPTQAATALSPGDVAGEGGPGARTRGRLLWGGLAAGAVALVVTLLLVVIRPFGSGLPDGWEAQHEEDLGVTWAMPTEFEKEEPEPGDDNQDWVTYRSPDGLYVVQLWYDNPEERDALQRAGQLHSEELESSSYWEADGTFESREFGEMDAAESEILTRSEEDVPQTLWRRLYVATPGDDLHQMWRVRVEMPGEEGAAREYGEELYETLVGELSVEPQEQVDPEEEDEDGDDF